MFCEKLKSANSNLNKLFPVQLLFVVKLKVTILNFLNEKVSEVDAILISDYDKGVVTNGLLEGLMALAKKFDKPVVVHPKIVHFLDYRGVTVVHSSEEIASTVTGISQINETSIRNMGQWLLTQLECEYVLITNGSNGMTLFGKSGDVRQMPSIARGVHNVTGVGTDDTVTSLIALSLAQDVANMVNSAVLANIAAGIVISKSGPATVTKDELKEQIDALSSAGKVS